MSVTTKHGRKLSEEDLDRLAERAEQGIDHAAWRPRRGRPSLDREASSHAPRISVRVPVALRDRATARAAREGRTISDVLRGLLEEYATAPAGRDLGPGIDVRNVAEGLETVEGPGRR